MSLADRFAADKSSSVVLSSTGCSND